MSSGRPSVMMVTGAYFPELSGAGLQCRELIRQLHGAAAFTVLTTTTDAALPLDDERDGVPVFRVFVDPSSVWSKFTAGVRMTRVLLRRRRQFSILHLHGFSQKSMLLVALALLLGKKVAIKLTSVGHDDPPSMRSRGRLAYWCYSKAHVFFGVSPRFQALFDGSGLPPGRFVLIPNGVDTSRFRPASPIERRELRASLNLPADSAMILFVGFFSREKCPDVLLAAWLRLDRGLRDRTSLVFVGGNRPGYYEVDDQLARDVRDRVRTEGVSSQVSFVEATREIDMYQRAADVFVLPSVREGLPNALLEAMACGAGCIATRLEGVTDTLIDDGRSGVLVPPREADALAAAMSTLLTDPDAASTMGTAARQRIARDFDLTKTAQRYLTVYRGLLAS